MVNEKLIFCSFNSKVPIKEDDTVLNQPENKENYYDRIKEIAADNLLEEIFKHLQPPGAKNVPNNISNSNNRNIHFESTLLRKVAIKI